MAVQWWQGVVAGGAATVVMTLLLQMGGWMGMTRMNMGLMLGSMFVGDPGRARAVGWTMHLVNGLVFGLLYAVVFWIVDPESVSSAWWIGLLVSLAHGIVALASMPIMSAVHPRVRAGDVGATGELTLPRFGFGGRGFGAGTPVGILMGHLAFGLVWGLVFWALV
jgi:hypothetical protein